MSPHHFSRKGKTLKNTAAHHHDHANFSRRNFLSTLGMFSAGSLMLNKLPISSLAKSPISPLLDSANSDRILVIIRMQGGNDSLNMVVPSGQYDDYANLRNSIRHQENDLYDLGQGWSLPNYMINPTASQTNLSNFDALWNEGKMSILHSVGYENMEESHIDAEKIWSTASDRILTHDTGWLGRYFNDLYPDFINNLPPIPPAIHVGSYNDVMFDTGGGNIAYLIKSIEQLNEIVNTGQLYNTNNLPDCLYGTELGFVRSIANSTQTYSTKIKEAYDSSATSTAYPNTVNWEERYMGEKLSLIARLIKGNLGTKVYLVDMPSFDTHSGQPYLHQNLLEDLAESISAFYTDLTAGGRDTDVLTMTISEFGRQIMENSNGGTDHGHAAALMMFGSGLNSTGFYGNGPDLKTIIDNGGDSIPSQLDYRNIYYTVLRDWLCIDESMLNTFMGGNYAAIPGLINTCTTTSSNCPDDINLGNESLNGNQTHHSNILTTSSGTVETGADIKLKSAGAIELKAGFEVKSGAEFSAEIDECN